MDTEERCRRLRDVASTLRAASNEKDQRSSCERMSRYLPECSTLKGLAEYLGFDGNRLKKISMYSRLERRRSRFFPPELYSEHAIEIAIILSVLAKKLDGTWNGPQDHEDAACEAFADDLFNENYEQMIRSEER